MPGPLGKLTVGRLRHRVTLQAATEVADAFGQMAQTWADEAAGLWAEVAALDGRELFRAGQVQANADYVVTLRHRSGVTPKKRLLWLDDGNAVLNVVAVLPSVGRANHLDVWCLRGA